MFLLEEGSGTQRVLPGVQNIKTTRQVCQHVVFIFFRT